MSSPARPQTPDTQMSFCSVCNKPFSSAYQLKRHTKSHTGEKPHTCPVCQRSFSESSHLKVHSQIHSGDKPHTCVYCQKSFIRNADLKSHIRIHTGEKPYECDQCDRKFTRSHHLGTHLLTHGDLTKSVETSNLLLYECGKCLKRFATKAGLNKHNQIHLTAAYGTRPFKCAICPKTFTYSHGLSRHARIHYQTRLYYCHLCPTNTTNTIMTTTTTNKRRKSFISMPALARHLHLHEPSVSCDLCLGARFPTAQELQFHVNQDHAFPLCSSLVHSLPVNTIITLLEGSFNAPSAKPNSPPHWPHSTMHHVVAHW
ncbi:hypothetical protein BASA81_004518 [Batrachochytrium salamandrivorans]|nr:hypothetical protein BASA81_004518 [Batrachochytrium salamandrivorans]